MSARHTPGPWKVVDGEGHYAIQSPSRGGIARVWGMQNAAIIAAAPELLTALEQLVEFDHPSLRGGPGHEQALVAARSVVEKARGGR